MGGIALDFDGTRAELTFNGMMSEISCPNGQRGRVTLPGEAVRWLSRLIGPGPVNLRVEDGRSHFSIQSFNMSFECGFMDIAPPVLENMVDSADLASLVKLWKIHNDDATWRSSGYPRLREALVAELNKRIIRAFETLNPFGVTEEDVESLVERRMGVLPKQLPRDDSRAGGRVAGMLGYQPNPKLRQMKRMGHDRREGSACINIQSSVLFSYSLAPHCPA